MNCLKQVVYDTFLYFCSKLIVVKIWDDISNFEANNPVVTIGSFDGVHLGHQQVFNQLIQLTDQINGESVIFTFSPHPATVLSPEREMVLLTTIDEKMELFRKAGIKHLVLFPFTKEIASLTYQEFVKEILVEKLHIHTLLVGYDHTIGKNREGNFEQLQAISKTLGFKVVQQNEVIIENGKLSSTNIRNLLSKGSLAEANKLLGYSYLLSGIVIHGNQLGNKLGFPTANLVPPQNKLIPDYGVYAVIVHIEETAYQGMMNIGLRPTINENNTRPLIEAHLFNFSGNLYDKYIKISIIQKLRDEYKFNSLDELKNQLILDKKMALQALSNMA